MNNIIFINFPGLVIRLRQFDIEFRINDNVHETALRKNETFKKNS